MKKSDQQRLKVIISIAIIFYSSFQLSKIMYHNYADRKASAMAQEIYYETQQSDISESKEENVQPKFLPLLEINPDVVGWLTIQDLSIDYPLVQASNNDFYLHKNFRLEDSKAGSIFFDFRNDANELGEHTILYGHRMKDGSMFGQLDQLLHLKESKRFQFETLYDRYEAEIFSVYRTTTDFYYIETDFASEEDYEEYLETVQAKSLVKLEVDVHQSDQILTLSTCDYVLDRNKGRLVVHAKLSKKEH